jgi:8-oxo-dGTP pyrophosphatase MutT (NUDIX family)
MTRTEFRDQLAALDLSARPEEEPHRRRMLALLDSTHDCFLRTSFPGHFTGSALVVSADGRRALLHHHRKLDRWLQFGGHCDGDEDIARVAQREALEESGIEGLLLASNKPFDLDIHAIPAHGNEPAHEHFDVRYVLITPEDAIFTRSEESHGLRWFTPDEMQALPLDDGLRRLVRKWQLLLARRGHQGPA